MAIKITVHADNDIENVSAREIQDLLRVEGISARRTQVKRLTDKQYRKGLA